MSPGKQGITMRGSAYGIHKETKLEFSDAEKRVRDALQAEGFGILTEIDVAATFKKKLDIDFPRYVILGACNPPLAHTVLTNEPDVGLLLPCNVVVYERADGTAGVSAMDPVVAFERLVENDEVKAVAEDVRTRITRALSTVADQSP